MKNKGKSIKELRAEISVLRDRMDLLGKMIYNHCRQTKSGTITFVDLRESDDAIENKIHKK